MNDYMNDIPYKELLKTFGVFMLGALIVFGTAKLTNYFDGLEIGDDSISCIR